MCLVSFFTATFAIFLKKSHLVETKKNHFTAESSINTDFFYVELVLIFSC